VPRLTLDQKRDLTHMLLIAVVIVPLFMINGRWTAFGNFDVIAADLPAWSLVNRGSLDISSDVAEGDARVALSRWFVQGENGELVSNRPPGLIGIAVPAYLLLGNKKPFSNGPGTAVAVLTTALAVLITWKILKPLVGRAFATGSSLVLALGTTTWWISSSELWPHGPGQLWAALATMGLMSGAYARSGAFFGLSIVTRPITAIFPALTGVAEGWRTRSWRPLIAVGGASSLGLIALLIFNRWTFGTWSVIGGYSDNFTVGAMDRFTIGSYLRNLADMLVMPYNGLLICSPIVLVAGVGAALGRKSIPGWAKSTSLAAIAYLIFHAMLNRASGGMPAFYRYPLEPLILACPLLAMGAHTLWHLGKIGRWAILLGAVVSIGLQIVLVFYLSCFITNPVVPACLFP
jgi:hypothetical protein